MNALHIVLSIEKLPLILVCVAKTLTSVIFIVSPSDYFFSKHLNE